MGKNVLLIGVGGTGSDVVMMLYEKIQREGSQTDANVHAIIMDTDKETKHALDKRAQELRDAGIAIEMPQHFNLAQGAGLGETVRHFADEGYGEFLEEWFPVDEIEKYPEADMSIGAAQWRKQSLLAFYRMMEKEQGRFNRALGAMASTDDSPLEIYTVSSIAGGTGSGSFIPATLYAKQYLQNEVARGKTVSSCAMLALPEIYEEALRKKGGSQVNKTFANGYAILRELSAMSLVSHKANNKEASDNARKTIKLRIGSKKATFMGQYAVLYDAEDERFWNAAAQPFGRIYLVDKKPNMSIDAHQSLIANSLYALICSEAGGKLASGRSNQQDIAAQSTNFNAIYGGIGTAELAFPYDSVMDYAAWRRVSEQCGATWCRLSSVAEEKTDAEWERLKRAGQDEKKNQTPFSAQVLAALGEVIEYHPNDEVVRVLRRGLLAEGEKLNAFVTDGDDSRFAQYVAGLEEAIEREIVSMEELTKSSANAFDFDDVEFTRGGLFGKKSAKESNRIAVMEYAKECKKALLAAYKKCRAPFAAAQPSVLADNILPMKDISTEAEIAANGNNNRYSVAANLLYKNKMAVHPVSAFVLLAKFECWLTEQLKAYETDKKMLDAAFEERNIPDESIKVPETLYKRALNPTTKDGKTPNSKSEYSQATGNARLYHLVDDEEFNGEEDLYFVKGDADATLANIRNRAMAAMKMKTYAEVLERVKKLNGCFRKFFETLSDEDSKRVLDRFVSRAKEDGVGDDGKTFFFGADERAKEKYYRALTDSIADEEEQLYEDDDRIGSAILNMMLAQMRRPEEAPKSDADEIYRRLQKANREPLERSAEAKELREHGIVNAMKEMDFKGAMHTLLESAEPAIQPRHKRGDLTAVLFPQNAARYVYTHGKDIGIGEVGSEKEAVKAFFSEVLQSDSDDVSIMQGQGTATSNNTIYVTREYCNVKPTDFEKFMEGGVYFARYETQLKSAVDGSLDQENPHIGFGWENSLPFMSEEYDKEYNLRAATALLYGILYGLLTYDSGSSATGTLMFRLGGTAIRNDEGDNIDRESVNALLAWMRRSEQSALVDDWNAKLEDEIEKGKKAITSENYADIEAAITGNSLVARLRDNLFQKKKDGGAIPMGLLEFAWDIHQKEENRSEDSNDGELVLQAGYAILEKFFAKINKKTKMGDYRRVVTWQTYKFASALATDADTLRNHPKNELPYVCSIMTWATKNGTFYLYDDEDYDIFEDRKKSFSESRHWIEVVEANLKEARSKKGDAEAPAEENAPADPAENK